MRRARVQQWASLGLAAAAAWAAAQDGGKSTGNVPLNDLGTGTYRGYQGGLYPGGVNTPPQAHLEAAMAMAGQIIPRDAAGNPDPNGKIAMVSIGMSNTTHEFAVFERQEDLNGDRNARLVIINGALGGQDSATIRNPAATYWTVVQQRLDAMGVTAEQVQTAWLKEAKAGPPNDFPGHAQRLQDDLRAIAQILHDRFPNMKICYVSSRIYGGYATGTLNPEPQAYESGFSVKWLIEAQISGDPGLNYDPARGPVEAPLLLWGPYLWADGVIPRSDGLVWLREDFQSDGTHPSPSGEQKVADMLSRFYASDSTAQGWFRSQPSVRLAGIDANADAHVQFDQPNTNFGAALRLLSQGGSNAYNVYVRFDVRGVRRPVAVAKLSFRVVNGADGNRNVMLIDDSSWGESTITYNSAPPLGQNSLRIIPRASRDGTVCADVTQAVNADADGVLTFALRTATSPQGDFHSKEALQPPRLILTVPAAIEIGPEGFTLVRGVLVSGGLAELRHSDDLRMVLRPGVVTGSAEAPIQLVLLGTAPGPSATELRFRLEAHASIPNIRQAIALFDFAANQWEDLDSRLATTSDTVAEVVVMANPSRFIQAGTNRLRARVSYKQAGPVVSYPWSARIDQTIWQISP